MRRWGHGVAWAALLFLSAGVSADTVDYVDDSGKSSTARGNIREETQLEVVIQTSTGQTRIPVYQIREVRYDGQPADLINVRSKFNQGRYAEVVEDLKNIGKTLDANQPNLQQAVAFQVFASLAEQAIADPAQAEAALKWYADFGDAFSRSRHYYPMQEYLGRVYLASKDFAKADQAFQNLEQVDWPGYKQKATVYRGIAALKQNQDQMALTLFDEVLNASGDALELKLQKQNAKIYKCKSLISAGKAEEAAKQLNEVLSELPPDDFKKRAMARNALGDAMRALKKNPKEIMLEGYMWVAALYSSDADELAYALYNLVDLFQQLRRPEDAQRMADRLRTEFPKSEWTQKLGSG